MGTSVNPSQINTIGSILESRGDTVLEKLSQNLKATEAVTPNVNVSTPAQISAVQDAKAAYGKATVALNRRPYSEAAVTSTGSSIKGATSQFGNAVAAKVVADKVAKPAIDKVISLSKQKEKEHFKKVFENIDKESNAAREALKERLKKYKAAKAAKEAANATTEAVTSTATNAGKDVTKTGVFKRIGRFFSENGRKVSEFAKTKVWGPIKNNPKIAAAVLAVVAVVGGTIYAMSGDKSQNKEQTEKKKV